LYIELNSQFIPGCDRASEKVKRWLKIPNRPSPSRGSQPGLAAAPVGRAVSMKLVLQAIAHTKDKSDLPPDRNAIALTSAAPLALEQSTSVCLDGAWRTDKSHCSCTPAGRRPGEKLHLA
jgi:hypothetical protein